MANKPTLSIRIDDDTELRILEERHAQELFNLIDQNRSYLREWLPWLDYEQSIEETKAFIRSSLQQFVNNEGFQAGIWYKGKLVGGIGYQPINWTQHKVEIGYWLSENAQG